MAGTNEIANIAVWTFNAPCDVPQDVERMLVDGEKVYCAFKTIRDVAIFTDKRLIVRDAQGFTGKKVETYTLPYKSIDMYSTENAGKVFDMNAEVELWTRAGHIKINLNSGVDIREIDKLLATCILK